MVSTLSHSSELIAEIRNCKLKKTCPELDESRQYYFEPNIYTIKDWQKIENYYLNEIDTSVVFVAESPGGFAEGVAPKGFPTDGSKVYRGWASIDPSPGVIESKLKNNRIFKDLRVVTGLTNCFMTNICKCGVRKGKKHTQVELENCTKFLQRELQIINPKIIVAFGNNVAEYLNKFSFMQKYRIFKMTHYSYYVGGTAWNFWKRPGGGGELDALVSNLKLINNIGQNSKDYSLKNTTTKCPPLPKEISRAEKQKHSTQISYENFFSEIKLLDKEIVIEKKSNKSFQLYYSIKKKRRVIVFLEPMKIKKGFRTFITSDRNDRIEIIDELSFNTALKYIKERLKFINESLS